MSLEEAWESVKNPVVKILIPAMVAASVKIAVESRKKTMSVFNIITSIIIAVGTAWLLSGLVFKVFSEEYHTPVIALVAISGEKFASFIILRFNIDKSLSKFIEFLIDWYRK